MIAKIKVATAIKKTTSAGKGYLNVKSSTGGYANIWEENQYLWHLFVPDAELSVEAQTDGKFTTITGVVGFKPEKSVAGQIHPVNVTPNGLPNFNEWLAEKIRGLEKKIDWLIEERKTLGELPKISGITEHSFDVKNEIKSENIPF